MAEADNRGGMNKVIKRLFVLCLVTLALSPLNALAQQYFDPGFFQIPIGTRPPSMEAPGARLGSFVLRPGIDIAWAYDDNVFYLPEDEISDNLWQFRPYASLNSDWNRHALNLNASGNIARYSDFSQNDYEDWTVAADGRLDVQQHNWFSADASFYRLHEDRRTPDAGGPATPTSFDYSGWGVGYDHIFNRLKLGAYYNFNTFDYDDNFTGGGEFIDNSFRNRDQDRYTLRGDWQLGPETAIFGSYGWNDISYDQPIDANGFRRDSDGSQYTIGMSWDMTDLLTGDVSANWSEQSYEDPRLADVSGFGLGAGLTWTPRPTTTIGLRMAASPNETTQPGTSGYFSQLLSARWEEQLREQLVLTVRGSYTDNDYENSGIQELELSDTQVIRADVGLSYIFNRNMSISGGYGYETQNSNISFFEYSANRLFVVLGLQL